MFVRATIYGILFLAAAPSSIRAFAQGLPATSPTQPVAVVPQPVRTPVKPVAQGSKRARVDYSGGLILVNATDSSLNQILREISRLTGMKVTGGVTEERVYGIYGPAVPEVVLGQLLNGTGSNFMLIQNSREMPQELVLTPRHGGPTPPNPNAGAQDDGFDRDEEDLPPQLAHHTQRPQPPLPVAQAPVVAEPAALADSSATAPDQSQDGPRTPQQIYDQLMKMQQQQPKTPQSTTSPQ